MVSLRTSYHMREGVHGHLTHVQVAFYSGSNAIARPGPPEDSAILTGMKMK